MELTLELKPRARLDLIDVNELVRRQSPRLLSRHDRVLYCSYHTTAGYFDQRLCGRLRYDRSLLEQFVEQFQKLFPPRADYRHDCLELRSELTEAQRRDEPLNADSHLTFMGSGLANCVTYATSPSMPAFFVDLDGVNEGGVCRHRRTTVVGFDREERLARFRFSVPLSSHPIDSVNLRDPKLGLFEELHQLVQEYSVEQGRIDIRLASPERQAALTVNEYETLLMKHDLAEVLANPFRFMAEKGFHILADPRAVPHKAKDYAKYDLVRFVNEFLDALGLSESVVERVVDRFLRFPASRYLRMKRRLSLLASVSAGGIVKGTYQSPVLVQWRRSGQERRLLEVTLVRLC